MTKHIPTEEVSPLDEDITEVREALREIKAEFSALKARALADDDNVIKEAVQLTVELRKWLLRVKETEACFEERRKQKEGIAEHYSVDLDRARFTIGCRLARLRKCCGSERVSGCADG